MMISVGEVLISTEGSAALASSSKPSLEDCSRLLFLSCSQDQPWAKKNKQINKITSETYLKK
jgi:hypothetical protein